MFSNFGLTLAREVWRRHRSDNQWILTSPHAIRQLRVTTSLLKQGHVQGKCELPQKQLLITIRRLCILCLKRFKRQILNCCDELWQGGVVMWCSPRFWGKCFSVAFKKQSRDCVNFVSYRSLTLPLVHKNSVIFKYTLHRWGYCFKNYLLVNCLVITTVPLFICSWRISNKLPFPESCDWILYFCQLCSLTV